ncbi:MAG TPA: PTS sugar transporter subunit IIA [Phycisphaerae bacterium]
MSEKTIHRWLKEGRLPNHRVRDKCRFNRVELLEWASSQQLTVSPEPFHETSPLTDALRRGGIIHDLAGTDKSSALKAVCDVLPLPDGTRRDELYQVLVAREALCSTGIGDGIAIPHPRGPIVLGLNRPSVTLAFLRQPIEFGALDARPVTTLFVIISTTVRVHLMMLSHLMFALQNKEFRRLVEARASQAELLARLEQVETGMVRTVRPEGAAS